MSTTLVRGGMYTGNGDVVFDTRGGDAMVVICHSVNPISAVSINNSSFNREYLSGNASVWYKRVPEVASATLRITAGSDVAYGAYVLRNAGKVVKSFSQVSSNISGAGYIDIPISSQYLSPGDLCLSAFQSTRLPKGTYWSRKPTFDTWSPLRGGYMNPDDGEIVRHNFQKNTSGNDEMVKVGYAYGGYYAVVTVVSGFDLSGFSAVTML